MTDTLPASRVGEGTATEREIVRQPDVWREAAARVSARRDELDAFLAPLLARPDLRIVLTGAGTSAFAGSVALVMSAFVAAYSNVLVKARGGHLDPVVLSAGQMLCGLVPLLIIGRLVEGSPVAFHWTRQAIVALLYLALVGSCLAFSLYYWLVRRVDVTKTMLISLVTPVVAVVLGMIWLDERLTWRVLIGGAAIICGIALNIRRRKLRIKNEELTMTANP
jgi:drug/metabolite transporter (DMT)-like permease